MAGSRVLNDADRNGYRSIFRMAMDYDGERFIVLKFEVYAAV
jgi:hypothetical protein